MIENRNAVSKGANDGPEERQSTRSGEVRSNKENQESVPFWIPLVWLGGLFCLLAQWSWQKWSDVICDTGEQLYIPWRLSLGEVLYRDIYTFNGPLSYHINAVWFLLFGASIKTLVYVNLGILVLLCWMIYHLLRGAFGRLVATSSCTVFLCVFAFSQYGPFEHCGNANYVTPYDNSTTHALFLTIAMILCLKRAILSESTKWGFAAGVLLGFVFLTKAENFVAALAAVGVGFVLVLFSGRRPWLRKFRMAGGLLAGAALPAIAAFFLLSAEMPNETAFRGVLGNWVIFIDYFNIRVDNSIPPEEVAPFNEAYFLGSGLDDIPANLKLALTMLGEILFYCFLALLFDRLAPATMRTHSWIAGTGVLLFVFLISQQDQLPWHNIVRAIPITSALALLAFGALSLRHRRDPVQFSRWGTIAMWSAFSFSMLLKILLFARVYHYGFVLAMPATLLLVACLLWVGPALWKRQPLGGTLARAIGIAAIGAAVVFFLLESDRVYRRRNYRIGGPGDEILVTDTGYNARGAAVAAAMERLEQVMPTDATLLVVPYGMTLNYWMRRRISGRYYSFIGCTDEILEDLKQSPPDFFAWIPTKSGPAPFGVHPRNGKGLMEWIDQNYLLLDPLDTIPFQEEGMAIIIGERNTSAQ